MGGDARPHRFRAAVWLRVPSLVLSTATVPPVYAFGRATLGHSAGLVRAALIALSPFALYYAIEARPYASVARLARAATWG